MALVDPLFILGEENMYNHAGSDPSKHQHREVNGLFERWKQRDHLKWFRSAPFYLFLTLSLTMFLH